MATKAHNVKKQDAPVEKDREQQIVEKAQQFWQKNGKITSYVLLVLILGVGGYFAYRAMVLQPNERKAEEAIWQAEGNYRIDSFKIALNGDASHYGFLKVISRYGGTKAGNLANFYAGSCYMELGNYKEAIKYLKKFSTEAQQVAVRATGLLGDAYAELGQKEEAVTYYKKAGTMFDKDNMSASEYLFRAGALYELMGKKQEAIDAYKLLKEKYPNSQRGYDVDKYLGRLGVTTE